MKTLNFNYSGLKSIFIIGASLIFHLLALGLVFAQSSLSEQDLQRIDEAVSLLRSHALIPPKSSKGMTDDIIRSYTRFFDGYGEYLTAKEYNAFQESANADYYGVEMTIEKQGDSIYLYPFKGGRAEKSGIRPGDELIAVNNRLVYGTSMYLIGTAIRGPVGETVQLRVRSGKGVARLFTLRREKTSYVSVRLHRFAKIDYIQITRFGNDTAALLRGFLQEIKDNKAEKRPLVLDLRQNLGGSLKAARQCADFFLAADTLLFRLQTREKVRDIVAEQPALTTARVVIVQDRNTASAAELFTAALHDNKRASTVGEKSFGKGVAQRFLSLADGSALRLTYAEIITPGGNHYNKKGLLPDSPLSAQLLQQDVFTEKTVQEIVKIR